MPQEDEDEGAESEEEHESTSKDLEGTQVREESEDEKYEKYEKVYKYTLKEGTKIDIWDEGLKNLSEEELK